MTRKEAVTAIGPCPPSTLAGGKCNPAYHRWRRRANPEQYTALRKRWQDNREKKRRASGGVAKNEVKCLECGCIKDRSIVHLVENWLMNPKWGSFKGICPDCI